MTWQQEAENVLQMIVDSPDSVPFRNAVNIEEFPVCNRHLLIVGVLTLRMCQNRFCGCVQTGTGNLCSVI